MMQTHTQFLAKILRLIASAAMGGKASLGIRGGWGGETMG